MSHTLVLDVSDEAYDELVRVSSKAAQSPEAAASKILNELLPDPLLRLCGTIESPVADVAARHDEYVGESIRSGDRR